MLGTELSIAERMSAGLILRMVATSISHLRYPGMIRLATHVRDRDVQQEALVVSFMELSKGMQEECEHATARQMCKVGIPVLQAS